MAAVQLQNTLPLKMIMLTAYKPTLSEIQLQNTPPQKMDTLTAYKRRLSEIFIYHLGLESSFSMTSAFFQKLAVQLS